MKLKRINIIGSMILKYLSIKILLSISFAAVFVAPDLAVLFGLGDLAS